MHLQSRACTHTFVLVTMCVHRTVCNLDIFLGKVYSWSRGPRPGAFETRWPGLLAEETRRRCSGCIWGPRSHLATAPGSRTCPPAATGSFRPGPCRLPGLTVPQPPRGPATASLKILNLSPPPTAILSSEGYPWLLENPRRGGPGGLGAAPRGSQLLLSPSPTWVYPTSPSREQAPLGGGGSPGLRVRVSLRGPGGRLASRLGLERGGHGRGRLAPGGRGSTTKLRPLSLRIGRAPQTGGGRALSRPSLSQAVLGPGVGRARASRPPAGGCAPSVRPARPATRESGGGGLGGVVPWF